MMRYCVCRQNSEANDEYVADVDLDSFKKNLRDRIRKYISCKFDCDKLPECIFCVNGDVIYRNKISSDHLIPVGSVTKQFTAYLVLKYLLEKYPNEWKTIINTPVAGIVDLKQMCRDAGNCRWLKHVTISQLTSHTSGLRNMTSFKLRMLLLLLRDFFSKYQPIDMFGKFVYSDSMNALHTHEYSDVNYIVLAMVVEYLYKKQYGQIISELAKEHDMQSLFHMSGQSLASFISGNNSMYKFRCKYLPIDFCYGTGSLCLNVKDLNKWTLQMGDSEIYKIMSQPVVSCRDRCYGYGLYTTHDGKITWHKGRYYSYCAARTQTIYVKQHRIAITFCVNDLNNCFEDLCDVVMSCVIGIL